LAFDDVVMRRVLLPWHLTYYQEHRGTYDPEGQPRSQHRVSNDGEKTVSRNEMQINITCRYISVITSSLHVNFMQITIDFNLHFV